MELSVVLDIYFGLLQGHGLIFHSFTGTKFRKDDVNSNFSDDQSVTFCGYLTGH